VLAEEAAAVIAEEAADDEAAAVLAEEAADDEAAAVLADDVVVGPPGCAGVQKNLWKAAATADKLRHCFDLGGLDGGRLAAGLSDRGSDSIKMAAEHSETERLNNL
jgi:hypothetical protein